MSPLFTFRIYILSILFRFNLIMTPKWPVKRLNSDFFWINKGYLICLSPHYFCHFERIRITYFPTLHYSQVVFIIPVLGQLLGCLNFWNWNLNPTIPFISLWTKLSVILSTETGFGMSNSYLFTILANSSFNSAPSDNMNCSVYMNCQIIPCRNIFMINHEEDI